MTRDAERCDARDVARDHHNRTLCTKYAVFTNDYAIRTNGRVERGRIACRCFAFICYASRMRWTPASRLSGMLFAFSVACGPSATGTSNAHASQCRIDTDVFCPGNFVGYSCQGEAKPPGMCSDGTLEFDGEIGYCCEAQK